MATAVKVTLTITEANALWQAAARGTDEWEAESDDGCSTINERTMSLADVARGKLYRAMRDAGGLT